MAQTPFRPGTFAVVPNTHLFAVMKGSTLSVYVTLCAHADSEGFCYPSVDRIGETSGYSARQVKYALTALEKLGVVIRIKRKRENGSDTSNIYRIMLIEGGAMDCTPGGAMDCTPITNPYITKKNIQKKAANAANQTQLSLTGSSRSDNPQPSPTNKRRAVVDKSTSKQNLVSFVEELHETIKGKGSRPLEKPELRVESLRKRLKHYTRAELLLAAKNLSQDVWFSSDGKKHQTVDFLLQGNRNQASGDNILRFLEVDSKQPTDWASAIDRRYGLATS